ncbi:MAG: DNA repair protein RecO [Elusimicrobia bacterium CG1_02_37_114]|nr:MAG: DNA repair protein RecO [Elusimicrobia bacterium CG1_02_37_114]PIV53947.1 MAG: DNA repair protein RecO [Elusimicrobia bacterium CG02_land_8_20_14_3_00_37_13]PIZ14053.1 MAG: DNA repair protein RecO [Elusimicrobia bacterium CG_4_10_14_0_8_um_filter_37_32]
MYHKTAGIVIKRDYLGEADKVLLIYTKDLGKVRAVAGGSRKITAKLLMATEPLVEANFMFYGDPLNGSFIKIVGGELISLFSILREKPLQYAGACQVIEIVELLTPLHSKNEKKYHLLKRTLELLEQTGNPRRIFLAFILRYMKLSGWGLELNKCVHCGIIYSSHQDRKWTFSLKEKGILCDKCVRVDLDSVMTDKQTLNYFHKIFKLSGEEVGKLDIPEKIERLISGQVKDYLYEYLPKPLKVNIGV